MPHDFSFYPFLAALILGYLLGSIPFGLLLTQAAGLGDVRAIGSGNIGATNVLRTGRRDIAAATLLLDGLKAAVALLVIRQFFGPEPGFAAGASAFLGHCYPIWLRFKGGKGVATFLGVTIAGIPIVGLAAALTWLVTAYTFRFSSLASLSAAALAPAFALAFRQPPAAVAFCVAVGVLIFWRHRANIGRLLRGEEPKIGARAASP